jgi:peroxiredoxin (alkyl hydroperoxide reductase subunit C)
VPALEKGTPGLIEGISSRTGGGNGMIMVGKPAPEFSAPAYHKGRFTHVRLSEHLGSWVLLFFYGGDYTFV